MTKEIIHFHAHGGKKTESHYELADALADEGDYLWEGSTLHSDLLYLANEVELFYEIDTETEEIELIGVDGEHGTVGRTPDPTWTFSWEDGPPHDDESDEDGPQTIGGDLPAHVTVSVVDDDTGDSRKALACEITDDDITGLGTVSFPLSGECPHDDP